MDSKSAIDLAQNPVHNNRSKHIRIGFVSKWEETWSVDMMHADMLTKALSERIHSSHMRSVVRAGRSRKAKL